jgi:hypothetical protein
MTDSQTPLAYAEAHIDDSIERLFAADARAIDIDRPRPMPPSATAPRACSPTS